jgi:transcription antitermination factor NusG
MATHKPINVQELFGELTVSQDDYIWRVIYTKHRMEKKLAEYAFRLGISYYLPLTDSVRSYQYRKVTFTKPLFPNYIFIKANSNELSQIYTSGCVGNVLKINNENALLEELRNIYAYRSKGAVMTPRNFLEKGIEVVVLQGPFEGLTGYVESQATPDKLVINVEILHQAVEISINPKDVKIIRKVKS